MARNIELKNCTSFVSTSDFQKHCDEMIERHAELKKDFDSVVKILRYRNDRGNALATKDEEGGLALNKSTCSQSTSGSLIGTANLAFNDCRNMEINNGAKSFQVIDDSLGITFLHLVLTTIFSTKKLCLSISIK